MSDKKLSLEQRVKHHGFQPEYVKVGTCVYNDAVSVINELNAELELNKSWVKHHQKSVENAMAERNEYKQRLEKAEKVIEFYQWTHPTELQECDEVKVSENPLVTTHGKKARAYFQEKQDQLKGEKNESVS